MKAIIVARVSTDEQKDALPGQTYRLIEYATKNNLDFELFEIKESAYKDNRSEFNKLIQLVQSYSELIYIVFDKIDRFSRDSSSDEVKQLNKLRKLGKVELHFPSDNLTLHKHSPATDIFRLGLGLVVSQYYSDSISDNVKRRREQMLRDGLWTGPAPVGYRNVINDHGKKWVEIDPIKSIAVKDAFEMYISGIYSYKLIAKKWREYYGLKAGTSKIEHVLSNPFYYGVMKSNGKLYPHN